MMLNRDKNHSKHLLISIFALSLHTKIENTKMKFKKAEIMKKNKKMKLNNRHNNHNNKNLNNKNQNLEIYLQKMLKNYKMIYNKLKHKYKI